MSLDEEQVASFRKMFSKERPNRIIATLVGLAGSNLDAALEAIYSITDNPGLSYGLCAEAVSKQNPRVFALSLELLGYILKNNSALATSSKVQEVIRNTIAEGWVNEDMRLLFAKYELQKFLRRP